MTEFNVLLNKSFELQVLVSLPDQSSPFWKTWTKAGLDRVELLPPPAAPRIVLI